MKKPFNLEAWLADKSQKVETRTGLPARIICTDAKSTGENPDRILALVSTDSGFENAFFYNTAGWCLSDSAPQPRKKDLFLVTDESELTDFEDKLVSFALQCGGQWDRATEEAKKWSLELLAIARKQIEAERVPKIEETGTRLTAQGPGVYKICPRCGERMERDDSKVYTSDPPQYGYTCPKCGEVEFDTIRYDSPAKVEVSPNFDPTLKAAEGVVFSDDLDWEIRDWRLNGWKTCTDYSSFKSTVEHFYNLGKSEALKNVPKWKKISQGEPLPCDAYLCMHGNYLSYMPNSKCVRAGSDGYYLPKTEIAKLPKEE